MNKRAGGILLPVFALPSPYGIGTLGRAAYHFADFLEKAGQKYWQILPLGPAGGGNSPYSCYSAHAGNPYFIDPELLTEEGLLTEEECRQYSSPADPRRIDYEALSDNRLKLLHLAFKRGFSREHEDICRFEAENIRWLPDYALFMALKKHFGGEAWTNWPEEIRLRRSAEVLEKYRTLLQTDVDFQIYLQYLFRVQWVRLRDYVHEKGLRIIGDVPIYLPLDSADVWAEPQFFELDENNYPVEVSGVPPDYFSEEGQLWGNPLYDWEAMKQDGYGFWIRRIDSAAKLFDVIRIDHFRGFDTYWAIPAEETSAKKGHWRQGPGMELVTVFNNWFPEVRYIAEDLGEPSPSVSRLLTESGWPGMKVLEFAFTPGADSPYLPHHHIPNSIVFTGTHDNLPLKLWAQTLSEEEEAFLREYLALRPDEDPAEAVLRCGISGAADTFIAPMQDWLGLGEEGIINRPGIPEGNWTFRMLDGEDNDALAEKIRRLSRLYGR